MILNRIDIPDRRPAPSRPFFNRASGRTFDVQAKDDVTDIALYDEIGFWGVTAAQFKRQLDAITTPNIRLKVNSPGGDVFDGIAMHNDLDTHAAHVTVQVTGVAASAASIVAMAGDKIEMPANAFMMIHNAWGFAMGDHTVMDDMSELLRQIDGALAATYAARTGHAVTAIANLMTAETWMDGETAVEEGFADAVIGDGAGEGADSQARFDLSTFRNAPKELASRSIPEPLTIRDLERGLRDAGYTRSTAKALASQAFAAEPLRDAGAMDAETVEAFESLIRTISA